MSALLLKDGVWAKKRLQLDQGTSSRRHLGEGHCHPFIIVWIKLLSLNWVESMLHHVCKDPELRLKMDDIRHFHYAW